MTSNRILYCHCAYARVIPDDVKQEVLQRLVDSGCEFDCVADLCEMSATADPSLQHLADQSGLKIVACYPRAVKWLFKAAKAPLKEDAVVHNMRTQSVDDIVADLVPKPSHEDSSS